MNWLDSDGGVSFGKIVLACVILPRRSGCRPYHTTGGSSDWR